MINRLSRFGSLYSILPCGSRLHDVEPFDGPAPGGAPSMLPSILQQFALYEIRKSPGLTFRRLKRRLGQLRDVPDVELEAALVALEQRGDIVAVWSSPAANSDLLTLMFAPAPDSKDAQ